MAGSTRARPRPSGGVPRRLRVGATAAAIALACVGLVTSGAPGLGGVAAHAQTVPVDPATKVSKSAAVAASASTDPTVSADALPAPQINGVVWTQTIVGNSVFAGGNFTTVRPAGAAPGQSETGRPYLLSYDIRTGVVNKAFAPVLNGQVRAIVAAADGKHVFVGGSFTKVGGVAHSRIVELDAATGAVVPGFRAGVNMSVNALVRSGTTLFAGGVFTAAGSTARAELASFDTTSGALRAWAPKALGGDVTSLVVAPDASKVVVGGRFTTLNGSSRPGYGLGAVDPRAGKLLPWKANDVVRNAGRFSGITTLTGDSTGVYGAGYVYGRGGDLEGSFKADWKTGTISWIAACHGDTYSLAVTASAVYNAGHSHDCAALSAFPETNPTWTYHRGVAFSKNRTQLDRHDTTGYRDFGGAAAPSIYDWYPDFDVGTFTGQHQGPWSVAANATYVVYGGEFTTVNGRAQQGLVRFATRSVAPDLMGPSISGTPFDPDLVSTTPGTVRVNWTANVDPDDATLTYLVYRDGHTAKPVFATKASSQPWNRPQLGFTDTGLEPGSTHSYRITAIDPAGNSVRSDGVNVIVAAKPATGLTAVVLAQKASSFWRFDQPQGSKVHDLVGRATQSPTSGVAAGASGALPDRLTSTTFTGKATSFSVTAGRQARPGTSSVSVWFRTTSSRGGVLTSFGNLQTGLSTVDDRVLYVGADHRLHFGASSASKVVLTGAPGVADGKWHQAVASVGPAGVLLYLDGKLVARAKVTAMSPSFAGYWRVGGDTTWDAAKTASHWFAGSIDDVAVFPTQLSGAQIAAQLRAAGR